MRPVVVGDAVEPIDDVSVPHFDCELAAGIEAAGGEVDRPDERRSAVREHHLAVKPQALELVDLNSRVVENPQPADAFHELLSLQRVRRSGHHMNPYAAPRGANQVFYDDHVLVPLVLNEQT